MVRQPGSGVDLIYGYNNHVFSDIRLRGICVRAFPCVQVRVHLHGMRMWMDSSNYTRRAGLLRYRPRTGLAGGFRSEQPRSSPVRDSGERVASCEGLRVSLVRVLLWGVSHSARWLVMDPLWGCALFAYEVRACAKFLH